MSDPKSVVVVGAGLSGLCCARHLQRAGHTVRVYEASDGVGGRVRSDRVDGFTLDRGFQVLFTAYPAVRRELNLEALKLQAFQPGAIVYRDGKRFELSDPYRQPLKALGTALSPLCSQRDKLRILKLRRIVRRKSVEDCFWIPDKRIESYLARQKFTARCINGFFRPFYAGIFLENDLSTSARMFEFVFKMMAEGKTALPANGMGAVAQQLASGLKPETVLLNTPVRTLLRADNQVTGVALEDGSEVAADAVVVATEADVAARLTGLKLPVEHRSVTCLYFSLPVKAYPEKKILLFAEPNPYAEAEQQLVNNAALLTNVAPSYAPAGKHLLSVTVLGDPPLSDETLAERVKAEIASYFPAVKPAGWRLLRIYRIRWAQFAQPVGIFERLPEADSPIPGLVLGGEITVSSSLHGALVAGQKAAGVVLTNA